MPPYGTPTTNKTSPSSHAGGEDARAAQIHKDQLRTQIENKLRIKKNEILDKQRVVRDTDRDILTLEGELHHIEQDHKRLSEEMHNLENEVKHGQNISKQEEMSLREADQGLHHSQDETKKLEHEIDLLKQQITEKERKMAEIKESTRHLMKDKEDHRRTGELEHFTVKSESEHLHERAVKLQLLQQDKLRKENELKHKQQQRNDLHRDVNFKEQEVMQLESELGHLRAS
jgi:chromosome segregation ATPase